MRYRRSDWVFLLILGGILIAGFAARVGGINFRNYADETITVYNALRFARFDYSRNLGIYTPLLFVFYVVYYAVGHLLGAYQTTGEFLATYFYDHHHIFVVGRLAESLAGTLGIWAAYRVGKELYSRRAGLVAALFLSFSYVHVYISQLARGQAFASLFLVAAFYFIARIDRKPSRQNYLLAGLFAGLALSIRINLLPIFFPLAAAHYISSRRGGKRLLASLFGGNIYLSLFIAAGVLIATQPYITRDIAAYGSLLRTFSQATPAFLGSQTETSSHTYYLLQGFPASFSWTFIFLFGVGFLFALFRLTDRPNWLILSFVIPYYLVMGKSRLAVWTYLFPIAPFIALLSAGFICLMVEKTVSRRWRDPALGVFCLLLTVEAIFSVWGINHRRNRPWTQNLSQQWVFENIPHGSRVAADSMGEQGPDLKRFPVIDYWIFNLNPDELNRLYEERIASDPGGSVALKYFIEHPPYPKYHLFNLGLREYVELDMLKANQVEYVVVASSVREVFENEQTRIRFPDKYRARMEFYDWLESDGRLIQSFPSGDSVVGPRIDVYRIQYR